MAPGEERNEPNSWIVSVIFVACPKLSRSLSIFPISSFADSFITWVSMRDPGVSTLVIPPHLRNPH